MNGIEYGGKVWRTVSELSALLTVLEAELGRSSATSTADKILVQAHTLADTKNTAKRQYETSRREYEHGNYALSSSVAKKQRLEEEMVVIQKDKKAISEKIQAIKAELEVQKLALNAKIGDENLNRIEFDGNEKAAQTLRADLNKMKKTTETKKSEFEKIVHEEKTLAESFTDEQKKVRQLRVLLDIVTSLIDIAPSDVPKTATPPVPSAAQATPAKPAVTPQSATPAKPVAPTDVPKTATPPVPSAAQATPAKPVTPPVALKQSSPPAAAAAKQEPSKAVDGAPQKLPELVKALPENEKNNNQPNKGEEGPKVDTKA
jgi:hypothetical protein